MFSSGYSVQIVVNGVIVSESKDGICTVPFNTDYAIRLYNGGGRRAAAKIWMDDELITRGVIVNAYTHLDVETFPDNPGCKFRFVPQESQDAVEAGKSLHRDGRNGVIRVEWKKEREQLQLCSSRGTKGSGSSWKNTLNHLNDGHETQARRLEGSGSASEGCTVEGEASEQTFSQVYFETAYGPGVVIQLKLKGYQDERVSKYCSQCGKGLNGLKENFCSKCGKRVNK